MSVLAKCAPSRWFDFFLIGNNETPKKHGENCDLFVGENISFSITIPNGKEVQFRDVVVLGALNLTSSNPDNLELKGSLVARDFFLPRKFKAANVNINGRNMHQHKDLTAFKEELTALVLEWLQMQRETVNEMGLKSILQ